MKTNLRGAPYHYYYYYYGHLYYYYRYSRCSPHTGHYRHGCFFCYPHAHACAPSLPLFLMP